MQTLTIETPNCSGQAPPQNFPVAPSKKHKTGSTGMLGSSCPKPPHVQVQGHPAGSVVDSSTLTAQRRVPTVKNRKFNIRKVQRTKLDHASGKDLSVLLAQSEPERLDSGCQPPYGRVMLGQIGEADYFSLSPVAEEVEVVCPSPEQVIDEPTLCYTLEKRHSIEDMSGPDKSLFTTQLAQLKATASGQLSALEPGERRVSPRAAPSVKQGEGMCTPPAALTGKHGIECASQIQTATFEQGLSVISSLVNPTPIALKSLLSSVGTEGKDLALVNKWTRCVSALANMCVCFLFYFFFFLCWHMFCVGKKIR